MVSPTSEEEKREAMARLKATIVVLVGASAGLITLSGGGSLVQIGVAVVVGSVVGTALLAYVLRIL
ncbi:hypothetical protein [Halorussus sp. MSC15.2]|uniref:hypothetical protein n=1 Tax=Halorussus sp. MSC15.2 TaxID=2283638 RepID=UPI0013D2629A|nr:hypothetical protein [Halorussus sp. MSC15.2]NEU56133.1 hypothetical protein [Halorussus sp. MSC15.2]